MVAEGSTATAGCQLAASNWPVANYFGRRKHSGRLARLMSRRGFRRAEYSMEVRSMRLTPWLRALTLALPAILLAATAARAAQPSSAEGRHRSWELRLQERLGLSDQQTQAIREIHQRDAEARTQHWQALRRAQAELRRAVLADIDQATLQARQAEVARLLAESVQMRVNTLKAIAPLLTPEQREQFAKLMEEGRGRHGHHRHRQQS
jgi:Spy/CpxP family protein refolding chaperone